MFRIVFHLSLFSHTLLGRIAFVVAHQYFSPSSSPSLSFYFFTFLQHTVLVRFVSMLCFFVCLFPFLYCLSTRPIDRQTFPLFSFFSSFVCVSTHLSLFHSLLPIGNTNGFNIVTLSFYLFFSPSQFVFYVLSVD